MAFKVLIAFVQKREADQDRSDQAGTTVSGARSNSARGSNKSGGFHLSLKKWIDLKEKGQSGFAAIHFAAFNGNLKMLNDLIKLGANVNAMNPQGMNVLHVSAQGDQPAAMHYFIEQFNMDINIQDEKRSTPLHWAAFSANELALSYILAWGANVNAQDFKGLTPLHLGVLASEQSQSTRLIRHLLIKGSDIRIKDKKNRTAYDYAAEKIGSPAWKESVCKILRESNSENKKFGDKLFEFLQIQQPLHK